MNRAADECARSGEPWLGNAVLWTLRLWLEGDDLGPRFALFTRPDFLVPAAGWQAGRSWLSLDEVECRYLELLEAGFRRDQIRIDRIRPGPVCTLANPPEFEPLKGIRLRRELR